MDELGQQGRVNAQGAWTVASLRLLTWQGLPPRRLRRATAGAGMLPSVSASAASSRHTRVLMDLICGSGVSTAGEGGARGGCVGLLSEGALPKAVGVGGSWADVWSYARGGRAGNRSSRPRCQD